MLAQIDEVLIVGGDDVVNIGARRSELTNPWDSFSFVLGAGILFGGGEGGGASWPLTVEVWPIGAGSVEAEVAGDREPA